MDMSDQFIKKIIMGIIVFLLVGAGLSSISSAKKIEKEQSDNLLSTLLSPEADTTKILFLDENEFNLLKNSISDNNGDGAFLTTIIDIIKNNLLGSDNNNNNKLLSKKTLVISQGWGYNFNIFKNSKFEMKRSMYSFWQFSHGSRNDMESKTLVIRPDGALSSRSAEMYKGRQMGFMYRPTGLYIFQKNMFPMLSYTLFIGYANSVNVNAEEEIELSYPLT